MIDRAVVRMVQKPWGRFDLRPWIKELVHNGPVGEMWFDRQDGTSDCSLLLKLLFTQAPLSIQVHPDDTLAQSAGQPNGKTEAWYILSAEPGAQVAIGLKRQISKESLRSAIADGSIVDLVQWYPVKQGDVYFVPAGIVHAIGAGIVLAEVQQRSDTTFRLFDYERQRELHIDQAVTATNLDLCLSRFAPLAISQSRTLVLANPYFVLEHIDLPADSRWTLNATREAWLFVIEGSAGIGDFDAERGQAVFVDDGQADIHVGAAGCTALLTYVGFDFDREILTVPDGRQSAPLTSISRPPSGKAA